LHKLLLSLRGVLKVQPNMEEFLILKEMVMMLVMVMLPPKLFFLFLEVSYTKRRLNFNIQRKDKNVGYGYVATSTLFSILGS
jgi:hypothetical protein